MRHAIICVRGLFGDLVVLGGMLRTYIERGDEVHVFTREDILVADVLSHIRGLTSHTMFRHLPIPLNDMAACTFSLRLEDSPWLYLVGLLRAEHVVNLSHAPGFEGTITGVVDETIHERIASLLGLENTDIKLADWVVAPEEELMANSWIKHNTEGEGPLVVLQFHATHPNRRLPPKTTVALYDALCSRGFRVIVAYMPRNRSSYTGLITRHVHALGLLPWPISCAVLKHADLCISTDTGIFHTAPVFGVPTVGIFGPTSGEVTSRYYPKARIVKPEKNMPCRFCYYRDSMGSKEKCNVEGCEQMALFSVDRIMEEVDAILCSGPVDDKTKVVVTTPGLTQEGRQRVLGL